MNREIKFRAWDMSNEMMFNNVHHGITFEDDSHYKFGDFLEDKDRWIIMQYTGLHDKNGKEIFESDIVRITEVDEDSCMGREETHIGHIKWIEDIAQWRFIFPSGRRTELYLIVQLSTMKECTVIGNIHQHPELLNS